MARFASDCTSETICPSIFESVVMSALLVAIGRVGTSIVAQGRAGTHSTPNAEETPHG